MSGSKSLIFLKLGVLVGGPTAVVVGLLGVGVYLGDTYREGVLKVESFVLGQEVRAAGSSDATSGGETSTTVSGAEETSTGDGAVGDSTPETGAMTGNGGGTEGGEAAAGIPEAEEAKHAEVPTPDAVEPPIAAKDAAAPTGAEGPAAAGRRDPFARGGEASPAERLPKVATPLAVPDDLLGAYATARRLKVRVLADESLVRMRPDWIDYVQQVISVSSANLQALVGVELSLYSVGRVEGSVPPGVAGLTAAKEASLEGADLLLVFTAPAREEGSVIPPHASGHALVAPSAARVLGARAVVVGSPGEDLPHTVSTLHEVAHLLGAEDITDVRDPAWSSGSFMSFAPLDPGAAPTVDRENLRRILARKSWPASDGTEEVEPNHVR